MIQRRVWVLAVAFLASSSISFADEAYEGACTDCHSDMMDLPVKHQGTIDAGCEMCHAPHGTNTGRRKRLSDDVNNLCTGCHSDKVAGPDKCKENRGYTCKEFNHGHPVAGAKDPIYSENPFDCASCHDPHSTVMPKIFRYDYRADKTPYKGQACLVCHWDKAWMPKPPAPPRRTTG